MDHPSPSRRLWALVVALGTASCSGSASTDLTAETVPRGAGVAPGSTQGGANSGGSGQAGSVAGGLGGSSARGTSAGGSGGLAAGCVDISLSAATAGMPPGSPQVGAADVVGGRRIFWRDSRGVHAAWTQINLNWDAPKVPVPVVISSFDASSGAFVGNHVFPSVPWSAFVLTAALAPDETVVLGGGTLHEDGTYSSAVLLFNTDTFSPQLIDLGSAHRGIYHIAWDGEAMAVHSQDGLDDYLAEVTRMATDGTILLPWTTFAHAHAYGAQGDFATDPITGVSIYSSIYGPALRGHTREGVPLPTANLDDDSPAFSSDQAKNWPQSGETRGAIVGPRSDGGFFVSWSGNSYPISTAVLPVGADLLPSGELISVATTLALNPQSIPVSESFDWMATLGSTSDLRLYASLFGVSAFHVVDGVATRSTLVQKSKDCCEARTLRALEWQGERWVQFFGNGAQGPTVRMVLDKEGCVYPAIAAQ